MLPRIASSYSLLIRALPSIYSDVSFAQALKERYPDSFILLVGTHPSSLPEETLSISQSIDGIARKEYDAIVLELAEGARRRSQMFAL